jgi:hypothetical protein
MTADDNDPYGLIASDARDNTPATGEARQTTNRPLGGLGGLVAVGCIINFVAFPMLRDGGGPDVWPFVALLAGFLIAQGGLAAHYLVWGTEPFPWRLFKHWIVTLGLFGSWAIGFALAFGNQAGADQITTTWAVVLCSLPLVSLATQLPMWPLRIYGGWRIELPPNDTSRISPSSLSIRDMILGTVLTAITLGALRLMPRWGEPLDGRFWILWALAALSIAGVSAVLLLPALVVCFRMKDAGTSFAVLCGIAFVAWILTITVLGTTGPGGAMPGEVLVSVGLVYVAFTASLTVPLLIFRSRGYRLTFASERLTSPSPPPATPPASPEHRAE